MASVNVGIITSHDTTPPASSTAMASTLAGWTTDHIYSVTYYEGGQMATALATEDILIIDALAVGDDAPSGGSSYYDPDVEDNGVPVFVYGWNSFGHGAPTEIGTWGFEYQGTGECVVPNPVDGEGIATAAGFSADDNFTMTGDGNVGTLTGTLAAGLEVIVETDGGDPALALLPDGATKVGGGAISGSLAFGGPWTMSGLAANADTVLEQLIKYLADEAVGAAPSGNLLLIQAIGEA